MAEAVLKRRLTPEFLEASDRVEVDDVVPVRDAATLLLADMSAAPVRLLMGKRRKDLAFMPGLYVFPGGALEDADGKMSIAGDLHSETKRRLFLRAPRLSQRRARALALAAIRETYEETGFLIGVKRQPERVPGKSWSAFAANHVTPSLKALQMVARAITPPYRPRRFDTRFFLADKSEIAATQNDHTQTDLEALEWLTLSEIFEKPLAFITRQILSDIRGIFDKSGGKDFTRHFPFYYARGSSYYCELIG